LGAEWCRIVEHENGAAAPFVSVAGDREHAALRATPPVSALASVNALVASLYGIATPQ
jgi:hypothetical protein